MTTSTIPQRELLPADRCDRCGARAAIRATKETGSSELLFCGHHGREHTDSLKKTGWFIFDNSKVEKGSLASV